MSDWLRCFKLIFLCVGETWRVSDVQTFIFVTHKYHTSLSYYRCYLVTCVALFLVLPLLLVLHCYSCYLVTRVTLLLVLLCYLCYIVTRVTLLLMLHRYSCYFATCVTLLFVLLLLVLPMLLLLLC